MTRHQKNDYLEYRQVNPHVGNYIHPSIHPYIYPYPYPSNNHGRTGTPGRCVFIARDAGDGSRHRSTPFPSCRCRLASTRHCSGCKVGLFWKIKSCSMWSLPNTTAPSLGFLSACRNPKPLNPKALNLNPTHIPLNHETLNPAFSVSGLPISLEHQRVPASS